MQKHSRASGGGHRNYAGILIQSPDLLLLYVYMLMQNCKAQINYAFDISKMPASVTLIQG